MARDITLIGAPIEIGAGQLGCLMGPDSFRTARLAQTLEELGHRVSDMGNLVPDAVDIPDHPNPAIHHMNAMVGWTQVIHEAGYAARDTFPIFLGGDHSLAAGSLSSMARHSADLDQPLYVLWLDAHPDIHRLDTTQSGNLHGTPMAYALGMEGFDGYFPPLHTPLNPKNVCMMGIRSVDQAENIHIADLGIEVHDMRAIDEHGIVAPLREFLARVEADNGRLHVSLDVDFLEPNIAPAVGTTVPGGATFREAHLIMEMVCDSGLATSLDLVELNPFLDNRGRTARLMVDLTASLLGRKVLDRPTRRF